MNAAEIAKFVHHQAADKFDVLRSDENDEGDQEVTAEEVDIAHQVLARTDVATLASANNPSLCLQSNRHRLFRDS